MPANLDFCPNHAVELSDMRHWRQQTAALRMRSVLLADDEESLRLLIYATLEDPDYQIFEASDGDEALAMAREHRPDIMVLDWMMPGKTGVEVAALLRGEEATRHTPIILLTAKSQQADINTALEMGVTTYLVKPFSPVALLDKVQEFLAGQPEHANGRR